jgi:acyl-coenzyme A synthetase/AMP-(fatty) acid ligase
VVAGTRESGRYMHPLLPPDKQDEYRRAGHWQDITLPDIVRSWAECDPDRVAVTGETRLTYGELWDQARRLAGGLASAGLQPGGFLPALMSSSWQGTVLEVAAAIAGAVFAPRSGNLSPAGAQPLFEQLDPQGLVINAELLQKPEWEAALPRFQESLRGGPLLVQGELAPGSGWRSLPALEELVHTGPSMEPVDLDAGAPCLVLSTGGTTGRPKSIVHCSNTLVYAARNFGGATEYSERDVQVAFAPYGHAGGSVFDIYMPLLFGASILPIARWQAMPVAEQIARFNGTFFITMGTHVFDLLGLGTEVDELLRPVRLITSGAGPDDLYVKGERRFGFPIVRVYGCSEMPGHAIGRPSDPGELRWHRDGVPFPGLEYRVVDVATGQPVAQGQPGEYQVRGPNLFMGYHGQPELTTLAVTPDGFYRSGDLLVESGEGYVTWSGRTKDIIRRGGIQIDPLEMENILAAHPRIHEVVVVGEPDPRLGERAVVVAVAGAGVTDLTLEELCARLLENGIPKQNLPEKLVVTASIPRTELGKFHRVEVKDRLVAGTL